MRHQDGKPARFLLPLIIATLLQYPLIKLLVYQSPDSEVSRIKTNRFSGKTVWLKRIEKKKEEIEEKLIGQVVDVPAPEKESPPPPDQPKYLSRYNTKTEKEQKAKKSASEIKKTGGITSFKHSEIQSPQSKEIEETKIAAENEKAMIPMRNDLPESKKGEKVWKNFEREKVSKLLLPANGTGVATENIQTITGSYASDDALLDITDEGDVTMLNSKKFKYWDFFNRVKEQVRKEWEPGKVYMEKDPYGKIYGFKDRLTILRVTIDSNGTLKRLETIRECGLDFLDREATKAFKEAQPFHNPPKGLLDEHGLITFNFGFLFEISSSRFKFFYQDPGY